VAVSRSLLCTAFILMAAAGADAQILTIGETLGKGKSGLLLSDNVIVPGEGIANLNIAYAELARGLSERFDLYLSAGETTSEGATQTWIGGGGDLRLARLRKLTLALFTVAAVPISRRDQACRVLLNPALVASVPLNAKLTVYSGVNALVPIGDRARGIFTPPSAKVNVPVGATYAIGPWGVWGEADFGNLRAAGIGLTLVF
jgi:hypothetical protein